VEVREKLWIMFYFLFKKFYYILVMGENCNICSNKCWGSPGYHGSCCSVEDRDYIIGPHHDTDEFILNLSKKFGREIEKEEVFIEYNEGKNLFPNKNSWQNETSYPAFRVDLFNPKLPCIFYNTKIKACSIYDVRPKTCREYECDYLKNNS
jgi:Fe-S-cluster containining protein